MLQMGTEDFGARARYYVMTAMTVIVLMGARRGVWLCKQECKVVSYPAAGQMVSNAVMP